MTFAKAIAVLLSNFKLEVSVNTDELQFNIKFTIDDQRKSEYVEEFLKFIEMPVDELESHALEDDRSQYIYDEQVLFSCIIHICMTFSGSFKSYQCFALTRIFIPMNSVSILRHKD